MSERWHIAWICIVPGHARYIVFEDSIPGDNLMDGFVHADKQCFTRTILQESSESSESTWWVATRARFVRPGLSFEMQNMKLGKFPDEFLRFDEDVMDTIT
jgi:hypothetical protein